MSTSGVSNTTGKTIEEIIASTTGSQSNTRKTGGELGKDDFLNLLVTQLRYQDPLEPTDDKEFIAQMAQFSSLEQMQNMNSTLSNSQAFGLIGKYVTATTKDDSTKEVNEISGQVSTVKMSNGKIYLVVNGKDISIEDVSEVVDMKYANMNIANYTNLIGYRTKGAVYDSSTGDIIYLTGKVTEIQKGLTEDYAVMDDVNVTVAEVTDSKSTDPDYTKKYLEEHKGKEVSITIKDPSSGDKVPITATLKSYSIDDKGVITAVLDNVYISVDSVSNIQNAESSTSSGTTT